jgi:hypothetical protein
MTAAETLSNLPRSGQLARARRAVGDQGRGSRFLAPKDAAARAIVTKKRDVAKNAGDAVQMGGEDRRRHPFEERTLPPPPTLSPPRDW